MTGSVHLEAGPVGAIRDPGADPARLQRLWLGELLEELEGLVSSLTDEQYASTGSTVFPSSIGGHVRHSLDHVAALVRGIKCGRIDYDDRERGTPVESSRAAALEAMRGLASRFAWFPGLLLDRRVFTKSRVSGSAPAVEVFSTVGRELDFVASHMVHHNAIIGAIARELGASVPPRFGYPPSTIEWLERNAA
jgi:uncharacterized damage-inducible protein DinB